MYNYMIHIVMVNIIIMIIHFHIFLFSISKHRNVTKNYAAYKTH